MQLTPEQIGEVNRLRLCFPFRIIYCAKNDATGEFVCGAVYTKHKPNALSRKGWRVCIIQKKQG